MNKIKLWLRSINAEMNPVGQSFPPTQLGFLIYHDVQDIIIYIITPFKKKNLKKSKFFNIISNRKHFLIRERGVVWCP